MTLRQLAEMSAIVALHGESVIRCGTPVSDRCLGTYFRHARDRHRSWRSILATISETGQDDIDEVTARLKSLLAEVLATEMLTRVWSAVLSASDMHCQVVHSDPIARHVLVGVLETRSQLLSQLLNGSCRPIGTLVQADLLRRKCDRWTDLLIGELSLRDDVSRFAVNPARAREFCEQSCGSPYSERQVTWTLLSAGLCQAVPDTPVDPRTAAAHAGVAEAIRSTLPDSPLNRYGAFQLPAVWRLQSPLRPADDIMPRAVSARLKSTLPSSEANDTGGTPRDLLAELLRRLQLSDDVDDRDGLV
ncbi:MAG: hypothetical protein KDA75_21070 [Planctomycetaceae bacterium]|nr:hypothetical protein [Planctomycetaceae bacterium]